VARPALVLSPPRGTDFDPLVPLAVSWSGRPVGSILSLVAGSTPGDSDVAMALDLAEVTTMVTLGVSGLAVVHLALWLRLGGEAWVYSARYYAQEGDGAATWARKTLTRWFVDAWDACPAQVPEEVGFDPDDAAHTAPWTPQEVRETVGYVLLRFAEVDRQTDPSPCGVNGAGQVEVRMRAQWDLEFEIRTPSDGDAALGELYAERFERLYEGVSLRRPGAVYGSIRQHGSNAPRRVGGGDDGAYRTLLLYVRVEVSERRLRVGAQEAEP
jgi:hypothetical protein